MSAANTPTTRRYARSLAEAFPRDHAAAIERPARHSLRWAEWAAVALACAIAVAALAINQAVAP